MFKFINTYVYLKISLTFKKNQIIFNVWFHSWLCIKFQLIQNIPKFLIGFMLCHTTSNLPPNCSNPAFSCAYFWVLFLACYKRRRGDPNDQWYRHNKHHYIDQHTIKISIPLYQIHWMNALKEEERKNCFNYHFLCNLSAYIMLMVDVHNKYFPVHKTWHQKRYIFSASSNLHMTFGQ